MMCNHSLTVDSPDFSIFMGHEPFYIYEIYVTTRQVIIFPFHHSITNRPGFFGI